MPLAIRDLTGGLEWVTGKGADTVDRFVETSDERQKHLTDRHRADMQSDNYLSKIIRPVTVLVLLLVVCTMGILSSFGYESDPILYGEICAVFMSAIGFYFNSKKAERMMVQKAKLSEKNAIANIKIKKIEAEQAAKTSQHEIIQDRKNQRHRRRQERRRQRRNRHN